MNIMSKKGTKIMEKDSKNNTIIDDKPGQAFSMVSPYGVMPHDVFCKPRKRIEYILSPKNCPDEGIIPLPFLLKIKDEDNYLIFKGLQTVKLSSEESYDKITNKNIIRYILKEHIAAVFRASYKNNIDFLKAQEYGDLTD